MARNDNFTFDFQRAERTYADLQDAFQERIGLVSKNESTGRVDNMLRSRLGNLDFEIKNLEKMLYSYIEDPSIMNLSEKEKQRRNNLVVELRSKKDQFALRINEELSKYNRPNTNLDMGNGRTKYQREADGETQETKAMNNTELQQQNKMMFDKQDEHLDDILGIVQGIRYAGQNINEEAELHNRLLDNLNTDMDSTHKKMVRVDNRLKELIAKSSNTCLWLVIIIELVVFVLILVFL